MSTFEGIEAEFRELNESIIKEYEQNLADFKEQQARYQKRLREDEKETREILRSSKIDVARLDKREHREADDLKKYLKEVRPKLVGRPVKSPPLGARERSIHASIINQSGSRVVSPYASSVLAPEKKCLEGIAGEAGNPWILPYNPDDINIKDTSEGSGWGCWAQGVIPIKYNVWFYFVPDRTDTWDLNTIFGFYGFYILTAHDSWYNCKSAQVDLEVNVNAYQYFWHGSKNFTVLYRDEDNIELYQFFDTGKLFDYTTTLKAGDGAWVLVQISMYALASGGGSYAEINFSDGTANYIKPFLLAATPY